jgi:hypothetical protein
MTRPFGIQTYTGGWFNAADPTADSVDIRDIAHALAIIDRFCGHTPRPYSVAQHSYLASKMAPPGLELQALMHDAHEAYVLDMPSPWKALLPDYRELEARVARVVRARFGLPAELDPRVKTVDLRLLSTEAKAFRMVWWDWDPAHPPYPELADLVPWSWAKAEIKFLDRFNRLTG